MVDDGHLLRIAVEDNVAWCSRICSAHGSIEERSPEAWVNFGHSPMFYPNIITRRKGVQKDVEGLARQIGEADPSTRWGITDSFRDLALADQGFERILVGHWYGCTQSMATPVGWNTIESPVGLQAWERAWGSGNETTFPESLLDDQRITFWFKGGPSEIDAGFISFNTGFSLGISNWFSLKDESFARMGLLQAAGSMSRGLPIVCWSEEDHSVEDAGLTKLGPLQVWLSPETRDENR